LWDAAWNYNRSLIDRPNTYTLNDEQKAEYDQILDIGGLGIMGYIEVPAIGVTLPIYHGTDEAVLQIAVGHLEWTSLPVGGESSHCVVSGHRGLPSAKLFTDLDKLVVGDIFVFRVLDEILTYEVDQILIVKPNETEALLIQEGQDLCTLITCTPYGVNSHRLLVRGHRVENQEEVKAIRVTADAMQIEPVIVAPIVAIPMLLVLLIFLLAGAFPMMELISRLLRKPLMALGRKMGVNEHSVMGFLNTSVNSIATFDALEKMDARGKVLNMAFAVSAAFVFGDHLAFTGGWNPSAIPALIVGKLAAGLTALLLALLMTRGEGKKESVGNVENEPSAPKGTS
jgi:sortase A